MYGTENEGGTGGGGLETNNRHQSILITKSEVLQNNTLAYCVFCAKNK